MTRHTTNPDGNFRVRSSPLSVSDKVSLITSGEMTVSIALNINSASSVGVLKEKSFSCTSIWRTHFLENNFHFTLLLDLTEKYCAPSVRPALDEMVSMMDVEADLAESSAGFPPSPIQLQEIEQLLTTSVVLKSRGYVFEPSAERIWLLTFESKKYTATFYPEIFDETPSLRLMNFGDPLFEKLLQIASSN